MKESIAVKATNVTIQTCSQLVAEPLRTPADEWNHCFVHTNIEC